MKILSKSLAWQKNYDLTGKKFGKLKVINFLYFKKPHKKSPKRRSHFLCKCDCGGKIILDSNRLSSGHTKSCGCIVKRKYKIDEKYFEKINREDKAYFFGLILTDGSIQTKKDIRIVLSLDKKDKEILMAFKRYLKSEKPLEFVKRKERYYGRVKIAASEVYKVTISVRKMVYDIVKLGLKDRKTKNVIYPNNKIIPHKLMRHFIRGVYDGDGTAHKGVYNGSTTRTLQFTSGSINFLKGFQNYLKKFKIKNTKITYYSRKIPATGFITKYATLQINPAIKKMLGNKQSKKSGRFISRPKKEIALNQKNFVNLIYKNCKKDLYLKRKRKVLENLIS